MSASYVQFFWIQHICVIGSFPTSLARVKDLNRYILLKVSTPGEITDLPFEWGKHFTWKSYMQDLDELLKVEGVEAQQWTPKR
jgi:hypothetical protein